jgi:hypothetical protein
MKLWREIGLMQRIRLITLLAVAGLAGFSLGGGSAIGANCWTCQRNDDFGGKFTCEYDDYIYADSCKSHASGCTYTNWRYCNQY